MKKLISLLILLSLMFVTYASHIMGGNIGYEYLGDVGGGMYRYKLTFIVYSNCDSQSNFPYGAQDFINYSVYQELSDPNANKPQLHSATINLVSDSLLVPIKPTGCSTSLDICMYEGRYVTEVDLPLEYNSQASNGFHVLLDVCCRNNLTNNIVNPGFEGNAFYTFIPSPLISNNSPIFLQTPPLYLCVGDTNTFVNTAFDIDGDSLIYNFVRAYSGYSEAVDPQPLYTGSNWSPNLVWPLPEVNYETGFDYLSPFGASSYAVIDENGQSQYKPSNIGNYVVVVEIKEYRSGSLVGIVRRDFLHKVVNFSSNTAPILSTIGSSGQLAYNVIEGENLCFDITFDDIDGDSVFITSNTAIFDSLNISVTTSSPVNGLGSAQDNFCWDIGCGQSRDSYYQFSVLASDSGCVPRFTELTYSIKVSEYITPNTIYGIDDVCPGQSLYYYIDQTSGESYAWNINGGTIDAGQGTDSILVTWNNVTVGNVQVTVTSPGACSNTALSLPISFGCITLVYDSICNRDSIFLEGEYQTIAGTYFDTLQTVFLTDSIIETELFVLSYLVMVTESICDYDSVYLEGGYQIIEGLYYDTLLTISGCDSVIQTTLLVYPSFYTTVSETICFGDSILLAGTYYYQPGTYIDTLTSSMSCDSIVTLNLTVNEIDTTVYRTGRTLVSNDINSSYQWINCPDSVLTNETNQTLVLTQLGSYAVELSKDGCVDTSSCVVVDCIAYYTWTEDSTGTYGILGYHGSIGTGAITYNWSFGDGNTSTDAYPEHTYTTGGTYEICLTITDATSCVSDFCDTISVQQKRDSPLTFKVIDPNGTGVSEFGTTELFVYPNPVKDKLTIELGKVYQNIALRLYDVTGKLVLSENHFNQSNLLLNVNGFESGMYLLKIESDRKKSEIKIVVE